MFFALQKVKEMQKQYAAKASNAGAKGSPEPF